MFNTRKLASVSISAIGMISLFLMPLLVTPASASTLLSLAKPATASSIQQNSATYAAGHVTDGNLSTRWASVPGIDPQWIYVDLQNNATIDRVVITWWSNYAVAYQIQVSNDATNWTSVYSTTTGDGAIDDIALSTSGRYVRMYGTVRNNPNNSGRYSIYEMEVYGTAGPTPTIPPTNTPGGPTPTPVSSAVLWDDFTYTSNTDPNMAAVHLTLRNAVNEGPGIAGATWSPNNISFLVDPNNSSNRLVQLQSTTGGTGATTSEAEIFYPIKFFEGTYATRIFFNDTPTSGADGDHVVTTYFSICVPCWLDDNDPNYRENDFEYLPNGGWGATGPRMYFTTWETYQVSPRWKATNASTNIVASYAGWHTLLMTVSGGHVKYYIDGALTADHSGVYYPEGPMSINYNLWFIDGDGATGTRVWQQRMDWTYFAKDVVLTPAQVDTIVANYKASNVQRLDTVPCDPTYSC
jgi:hypothetical protein